MATYSVDFKYDDGDDSHYEAETEQSVKNLINYSLGNATKEGLMSIIITVEEPLAKWEWSNFVPGNVSF